MVMCSFDAEEEIVSIGEPDAPAQSGLFLDGDQGLDQLLCVDDWHGDSFSIEQTKDRLATVLRLLSFASLRLLMRLVVWPANRW
jgi:hypothetical protein